jgi:hypothetical protein
MFATEYEALGNTLRDDDQAAPSGSALYALWRSKGSRALLLRVLVAQITMLGVLTVFYVLAVATNYAAFHRRAHRSLCPPSGVMRSATPNQATVFETDCWGDMPVDMGREPSRLALFALVSAVLCMAIEMGVCMVVWRRIRCTETWWHEQQQQHMHEIDWDAVREMVGMSCTVDQERFDGSVTRRSDAFVRLYNGPLKHLRHIPSTTHSAISAAVAFHRRTHWSPAVSFRVTALLTAVAIPYLCVALLCQFVFRNGAVLRGGGAGVGSLLSKRRWSRRALWTMRNEGEPTHVFEQRMEKVSAPALRILDAVPVPHPVRTLANMILILSACFGAAVLVVTLVVDDALFSVYLTPGRTAGFYVGLAGVVMAVAAPLAATPRAAAFDAELSTVHELAPKLLERASCMDDQVKTLENAMQYWGFEFLVEIASLFTTPWTLWCLSAEQVAVILR